MTKDSLYIGLDTKMFEESTGDSFSEKYHSLSWWHAV